MVEDTERRRVQTYVPAYQKETWTDHADRLGMSQSEFVRTMVQAGRRKFEVPTLGGSDDNTPEDPNGDSDPGGEGLEPHVLEVLSSEAYRSWEELVEEVTSGIEDELDETLQTLQTQNRVQFSGRHGGYTLNEGRDGD